jgi:hypothetical protein
MNELDEDALPFITPMIRGHGKHLHEHGQTVVASWASKIALALHLTTSNDQLPPTEQYREIARTHRPPAWTFVWLAAYQGLSRLGFQEGHLLVMEDPSGEFDAHVATILVGHLLLQVFGYVGEEMTLEHGRRMRDSTFQIWPYVGPIVWPPKRLVNERDLTAFTRRFAPRKV